MLRIGRHRIVFAMSRKLQSVFLLRHRLLGVFVSRTTELLISCFRGGVGMAPNVVMNLRAFNTEVGFGPRIRVLIAVNKVAGAKG